MPLSIRNKIGKTPAKTLFVNTSTNAIFKGTIEGKNVQFDFSVLEKPLADFQQANPNVSLYFRFEMREFQADVITGNSKSLRAGKPVGPFGVSGAPAVQANTKIDWNELNQAMSQSVTGLLQLASENKKPLKMVLSVYDLHRFLDDKSVAFDMPIAGPPNYTQGGSLITLVGWNVDIK